MNVPGTSSSGPATAGTTGTSGTSGPTAGSPSASPRPPEGLSPRRAAQIDQAQRVFECNAEYIARQTTRILRDANPADRPRIERGARQQIAQLRRDLDQNIKRIQNPPMRPASSEPAHRVVGFEVKPQSP